MCTRPNRLTPLAATVALLVGSTAVIAQTAGEMRVNIAGMAAHHLCSGMFVVGRDYQRIPSQVVAGDIKRFEVFNWQDDFEYSVDQATKTASVWGDSLPPQSAEYNGDQGCTILPEGSDDVAFGPVVVERHTPDPTTTEWPTGDQNAEHEALPAGVDGSKLQYALDWVMSQSEHNTRALVVVYQGKILAERYADGFGRNTPQIGWSQGKSIASALVGAAMQAGHLDAGLDDPAPVAEWQDAGDPRNNIRMRDLLQMRSGLDFKNLGLTSPESWTDANEHFRIYFEGINVYEHAIDQPGELEPGARFRYRNSDPLTLTRIVRGAAEANGEAWLTYPQRVLFDRIGARSVVLEPDAWGNFIISGYDYASALDWARFGLLHLWDGEWPAADGGAPDRILPEGWVDFISAPREGAPFAGYGGLFWLNRAGALPRAPEDTYYAAGFMGQYTAIIPSYDLVIVRLGPSPGDTNKYLSDIIGEVTGAITR